MTSSRFRIGSIEPGMLPSAAAVAAPTAPVTTASSFEVPATEPTLDRRNEQGVSDGGASARPGGDSVPAEADDERLQTANEAAAAAFSGFNAAMSSGVSASLSSGGAMDVAAVGGASADIGSRTVAALDGVIAARTARRDGLRGEAAEREQQKITMLTTLRDMIDGHVERMRQIVEDSMKARNRSLDEHRQDQQTAHELLLRFNGSGSDVPRDPTLVAGAWAAAAGD